MQLSTNKMGPNFPKWLSVFCGVATLLFFEGQANSLKVLSDASVSPSSEREVHIKLKGRVVSLRSKRKKLVKKKRVLSFKEELKLLKKFANNVERTELYRTVIVPDMATAYLQEELAEDSDFGVDWKESKKIEDEEVYPYKFVATQLIQDAHNEIQETLSDIKRTPVKPFQKLPLLSDETRPSVPEVTPGKTSTAAASAEVANTSSVKFPQPRLPLSRSLTSSLDDKFNSDTQAQREPIGTLYGAFSLSKQVLQQINTDYPKGWHIELQLEPAKRLDTQTRDIELVDSFFYNSSNAQTTEFQIEEKRLMDPYRLWARLYVVGQLQPVASFLYPDLLRYDYGQKIRFFAGQKDYQSSLKAVSSSPSEGVTLNLSIFEGAAEDFRAPQIISGAQVQILNLEENISFVSSSSGHVRIPQLPNRSEIVVRVSHPNYFPTESTIALFQSNVVAPIYLLSRKAVEKKGFQSKSRSLVVERVYNPATRQPSNQRAPLKMSYRKDLAIPFKNGLHTFFNVIPSIRSISRSDALSNVLLDLKEGFGYYVESGRFGKRTFTGKILDGITLAPIHSKIKIVGQNPEFITNEKGEFEISNLEVSQGALVLEIESHEYGTSWVTVPVDSKENLRGIKIFLLEKEVVFEAMKGTGKKTVHQTMGTIFGGANTALFSDHEGCNTVELLDGEGKLVNTDSLEIGPFSWTGSKIDKKLCLTAQSNRFFYQNVLPGKYILNWKNKDKKVFRTHLLFVGKGRTTLSVN